MKFKNSLIDIQAIDKKASYFGLSEPEDGVVILLIVRGTARVYLGSISENHPDLEKIRYAFALANTAIDEVRIQYRDPNNWTEETQFFNDQNGIK